MQYGGFILDVITSVPAFAVAVGVTAGMSLGTSTLTTSVIPPIVKMAGYGTAALNVLFTANEIYSSSLMFFDRNPEYRNRYRCHFWARGYYCETVGNVNEETIKKYIDEQYKSDRIEVEH